MFTNGRHFGQPTLERFFKSRGGQKVARPHQASKPDSEGTNPDRRAQSAPPPGATGIAETDD
jgi:hypothetical protein